MGQQTNKSIQIKRQQKSINQLKKNIKQLQKYSIKHQNIIKVIRTPFQNCQQIQLNNQTYFIEYTKISLKNLIIYKINHKKIFQQFTVILLIQNLTYALAYLQNLHTPYPFLIPQNIYQCDQCFKLFPPTLLKHQTYIKLKQCIKQKSKQYIPASPQMIIALRCKQPMIKQQQILFKSNVFALGLILLEVCTLKSSSQCYDLANYDILDQVITGRIEYIQTIYSKKVVRIIANMLDYDFQQRMTPNKLSIWVNRTLKQPDDAIQQPNRHHQIDDRINDQIYIANSRLVVQQDHQQKQMKQNRQNKQMKLNKSVKQFRQYRDIKQDKYPIKKTTRIEQIRAKINRQKICAQFYVYEDKQLIKNKNKCKNGNQDSINKKNKKDLFNPYFHQEHIQKFNQKCQKTDRTPKYQHQHKRSQTKQFLPTQQQKYPRLSYQLSNHLFQQPINSKSINLKYKYNVDNNQNHYNNQYEKKQHIYRQLRIDSQIQNYKRTLSTKKYDYNIKNKCYLNLQTDPDNNSNNQISNNQKSNKQFDKQSHKGDDFSFQPLNLQKQQKQLKRTHSNLLQQKQPKLPLEQKTNITKDKKNQQIKIYEKLPSQKTPYQPTFQPFQAFPYKQQKSSKNSYKQSQDILQVKKQIQRSRKIIQQVKKIQQNDQ